MEIIEIRQDDDLSSVARKCNTNFKKVSWDLRQSSRMQELISSEAISGSLQEIRDDITEIENVTIPTEVSDQLAAANIPGQVTDEVTRQMSAAYPPVSSYVMMAQSPTTSYPGTTWSQVDSVLTVGNVSIPLWQRLS